MISKKLGKSLKKQQEKKNTNKIFQKRSQQTRKASLKQNLLLKVLVNILLKLAKDIGTSTKSFNECIKENDTTQPEKVISVNELKDAFFSLKINKSAQYDDISFNVVKKCFEALHKPLLHIFDLSLQIRIFPDKLKIARVTTTV